MGGVEVTGAGIAQVNGWYRRRETRTTRDNPSWRPQYQKDDGYRICWSATDEWLFKMAGAYRVDGIPYSSSLTKARLPPAEGWSLNYREVNNGACSIPSVIPVGLNPPPTLRVVPSSSTS